MKNFKQLLIWRKGFEIAVNSFALTATFPKSETFALSKQITTAAVSIPSNIAEGSSRTSEKGYNRFLQLALGSAFELETHLLISEAVNFGDGEIRSKLAEAITEEQKMLTSFMKNLNK